MSALGFLLLFGFYVAYKGLTHARGAKESPLAFNISRIFSGFVVLLFLGALALAFFSSFTDNPVLLALTSRWYNIFLAWDPSDITDLEAEDARLISTTTPKFQILMLCTPNYDAIGQYGVASFAHYAKSHNYQLTLYRSVPETFQLGGMHVNWNKIAMLRAELAAAPQGSYVVLADADMVVLRPELRLEALLEISGNPNAVIYAAPDALCMSDPISRAVTSFFKSQNVVVTTTHINAGFMILKAGPRALELVDLWLESARGECSSVADIHPRNQNVFTYCVAKALQPGELGLLSSTLVGNPCSEFVIHEYLSVDKLREQFAQLSPAPEFIRDLPDKGKVQLGAKQNSE